MTLHIAYLALVSRTVCAKCAAPPSGMSANGNNNKSKKTGNTGTCSLKTKEESESITKFSMQAPMCA